MCHSPLVFSSCNDVAFKKINVALRLNFFEDFIMSIILVVHIWLCYFDYGTLLHV